MSKKYKGIGSSDGIAIAKAFLFEKPEFKINNLKIKDSNEEYKKFSIALEKTINEIKNIKKIAIKKIGEEKSLVFDAHIQIAQDIEIINQIKNLIKDEKYNGAYAIDFVFNNTYDLFSKMEDEYFKQRASDIRDIQQRLLSCFLDIELPDLLSINTEVIVVANDLTPSETALLDKKFVKGFVTNIGGRTSHAAIMARTLEIPAVLGIEKITKHIKNNDLIAIDGLTGEVEVKVEDIKKWEIKINEFSQLKKDLLNFAKIKTKTLDGFNVDIEANIGKPSDVDNLEKYGAEGVGLFRSEFLYMDNNNWPTEDEQFESYKYVLEKQKDKLVIVRTLDIGGDKELKYFKFDHELNPFLGNRAIRFCLNNLEVFKTQITALLKASVYGKLGIMFPMIATIDEFLNAKNIVEQVKKELDDKNIKYSKNILIGMMVEIPSTALMADKFAKYSDFFSIGTNDLIQYTFAADRMSEKVSYLYQPNNPALLKAIHLTIMGAKKYNRMVAMCGEMAGDYLSIPLLLGLGNHGLDAFSMSASSIPKAKKLISSLNKKDCIELANKSLECETSEEVIKLTKLFLSKKNLI